MQSENGRDGMSDLKPCPFCGDTPIDVCENTDGNRIWYSVLSSCGNEVCNITPDKVESDWNTRPIEDSLRQTISTLETAFNEARKEAGELEGKLWDKKQDFDGLLERFIKVGTERNQLQAEVERLEKELKQAGEPIVKYVYTNEEYNP
jgi:septal ring factor EnvC (AmiA/AmiB activator)